MQLKDNYETFIKSHLSFPKDPNDLEIKSFEEFVEKNVEWSGYEAKDLNEYLTKERARPNQAYFKGVFLEHLTQESLKKKPIQALEKMSRVWKSLYQMPNVDCLYTLQRIQDLYKKQNTFVQDFFLLKHNGSFLFHSDNYTVNDSPSFIKYGTFIEKEYEEED